MVYCIECGTNNEDNARYCIKCGVSLNLSPPTIRRSRSRNECFGSQGKPVEEACFGLPFGGAILGIIFGIVIIIVGIFVYLGKPVWGLIGPLMAIMFGLLLIIGTFYQMRRK